MTSSPPAKRFDWGNLRLRILSAVVLGPATILVLWFGGWPFLLMLAIASTLLAIEWGLMSTPEAPAHTAGLVTVAVQQQAPRQYDGCGCRGARGAQLRSHRARAGKPRCRKA